MNRSLFSMAACLAFITAGPAAAQERFSLSGDRIAIYNVAGEVAVEAGTGANVIVEVARGGDDAGRLTIDRNEEDGWNRLIIRYPSDRIVYRPHGRFSRSEFGVRADGSFGPRNLDPGPGVERVKRERTTTGRVDRVRVSGSGRGLQAHANLRVLVPAGHAVSIHLGVGKIRVSNVDGDIQLDARSAAIEADGVQGFGRFDTGSGSINLRNGIGDFGLHTGSGAVSVNDIQRGVLVVGTGSGAVHGTSLDVSELQVNTGSGSITINGAQAPLARLNTGSGGIRAQRFSSRTFDMNTGSGSVRVELSADVQNGEIETGSGGVQIVMSREVGAQVTADTGSGGIDVDAPISVTEKRRSFMRGTIGDGAGTLSVNTGSGGISFRSY